MLSEAAPAVELEASPAAPDCAVKGLDTWLLDIGLSHYYHAAVKWCDDCGAVELDEVKVITASEASPVKRYTKKFKKNM